MGMGLQAAYAGQALHDSFEKLLAERRKQRLDERDYADKQRDYADTQRQQQFDNDLRLRDADDRRRHNDESRAALADRREANADLRRQNAATRLESGLAVGDVLDPTALDTLRGAGRGSNIEHQSATLPSTQHTGFIRTGLTGPQGGAIRTTSYAGNPEQDLYRGTRQQRVSRQLIESLPAGSRERLALEYQEATGNNAPASFLPAPQRDPTPHYQLQPLYDESGRPSGGLSFNQLTGEARPITLPGNLRAPGRGQGDDPELPRGVQQYLLQLRSKYPSYNDAVSELARAMPPILQAHPSFNTVKAGNALRQLFTGADSFSAGGNVGPVLEGDPSGGRGAPPPARPTVSTRGGRPAPIQSGQIAVLKDGRRVRITQTNPDGTFEYEEIP